MTIPLTQVQTNQGEQYQAAEREFQGYPGHQMEQLNQPMNQQVLSSSSNLVLPNSTRLAILIFQTIKRCRKMVMATKTLRDLIH